MALTELLQGVDIKQVFIASISILLGGLSIYVYLQRPVPLGAKAPKMVKNDWPLLGSLAFFTKRWDFFQEAMAHSVTGNFSFHAGKHPVVGLTGHEARKLFLESRDLNFSVGYQTLFAAQPTPPTLVPEDVETVGENFPRTLLQMLRTDNLVKALPHLISDIRTRLDDLAKDPKGVTNPFQSIYAMVYQLTMRMVACNEIANDSALLDRTLKLFETVEAATSPELILFPWLPSPAKLKRFWGGAQLYMIFKKIVDDRKKLGKREFDPLQVLVDRGDTPEQIVTFVLGALFAGQLNSGINAAWILAYLAKNPDWLEKVRKEVESVAARYDGDSSKPLAERLASVPLEAWETEFPGIDLCLRDSIRLQALGTMFRCNTSGKAINVGNEEIPPGAFVTYHLADIHLNPEVYPDPTKWDPSRYLPERAEDQKEKYGFIGWGGGRHPCLGMRFAKFEQNIMLAFFLAYFDFELCDKDGNLETRLPQMDFNGHSAHKPKDPVHLKYRPRV